MSKNLTEILGCRIFSISFWNDLFIFIFKVICQSLPDSIMSLCRLRRQAASAGLFVHSFFFFSLVPISTRKLASSTEPSAEKELSSAVQNQMVQRIDVPCTQHSPVMHQKLCEHVQTQMALMTGQPSQNRNEIPTVTPFSTSNHG